MRSLTQDSVLQVMGPNSHPGCWTVALALPIPRRPLALPVRPRVSPAPSHWLVSLGWPLRAPSPALCCHCPAHASCWGDVSGLLTPPQAFQAKAVPLPAGIPPKRSPWEARGGWSKQETARGVRRHKGEGLPGPPVQPPLHGVKTGPERGGTSTTLVRSASYVVLRSALTFPLPAPTSDQAPPWTSCCLLGLPISTRPPNSSSTCSQRGPLTGILKFHRAPHCSRMKSQLINTASRQSPV